MFYKRRQSGRVYAFCYNFIMDMKYTGDFERSLGLLMPNDDIQFLAKYLSIFDSFGATTTYKVIKSNNKFTGYRLNIKLT